MRKLIEKQQNSLVTCDNPNCDYTVPYSDDTEKYLVLFIDKPCPKCGENLLTMEDYLQHQNLMKVVNFINRWFSWITIFYTKKAWAKRQSVSVHVHDGVKVSQLCPCCGSDKTYKTDAIHCSRCATTTEI